MDLQKMIAELEAERNRLDQAIDALERLSTANGPRRGRPPAWLRKQSEKADNTGDADSESHSAVS